MTLKEKLLKLAEEIEFKILELKSLQKETADLLKNSGEEFEKLYDDPEIEMVSRKLNKLMKDLW